jgi:hypothetical protein
MIRVEKLLKVSPSLRMEILKLGAIGAVTWKTYSCSWNLMKMTLTRRFNSSLQSYEAKLWTVFEHTKLPKKKLMTNERNLGMKTMYWNIS